MAGGVTEGRSHSGKFRVAYVLLAVVAIAGIGVFFAVQSQPSTTTATGASLEEAWGSFQPAGLTQDRIQQIALHVSAAYRSPSDHQLVSVSASIPPVYQNDLKITQYILSYNDGGQTNYQAVPISANNVRAPSPPAARGARAGALHVPLHERRVGRDLPPAEEGRAAAVGVPLPADAVRAAGDPLETAERDPRRADAAARGGDPGD